MLLATAAYITRSTLVMCIAKPDWAYERVFLGSLMLASKVKILSSVATLTIVHHMISVPQ